ncbi:nucleotide-diphospho-sugar transferase [Metschnikowia bicuspidata var. bicuspidata NRRL YB-4993]|uniref:Nucleotide-diphospho-sugar transferase n=1 Tax=Metschnikowia bicuspidata var. bicuspidata NRRL YB-4993 TaxID=869754 RepID=A0A1A0HHH3_9ASCO|nr:nucleotide-diphospho-sugar transferase [Metschnikowia bicuspidata var. bicuspidata NRRL YB-4993]OBA23456.1 nucleotide-diphospho-sugar transferase [Metschnikowia bicuspidata var. bicuspidata NRRL YB-4993]
MRFLQSLFLRLRLQRRRHKSLSIVAAALLLLVVFSLLYFWRDFEEDSLPFVKDPKKECGLLPSFMCNWRSTFDEPKDIKQGGKKISFDAHLTKAEKIKLGHIKTFSGHSDSARLATAHAFYKNIFKDIINAKPEIENKLENYKDDTFCSSERYDDGKYDPLFSEKYLSSFLQLSDSELKALTASHKYMMNHLPEDGPAGLYKGDGIVFVGGGKFNWLTLLSIRTLRAKGCELPVEILIPTLKEYDMELCTKVFPALNAKCMFLPMELYGDDLEFASSLSFKGYQYKSLAILISSFENVLLLDSDNIAAFSPEHLFKNEPFLSSGLVVWPDFWRRSTSPSFYQIAGEKVSKKELLPKYVEKFGFYQPQSTSSKVNWFTEVPYHERVGTIPDPSSESGQLMVSKKSHLKAVLLALYYNSYGPKFFYPIFSQGTPGEGDKETFLAATVVLKKSFYQVGKFLTSLGNVKNGEYKGHAMGQYDPVDDYNKNLQKQDLFATLEGTELKDALGKVGDPRMLFLHANYPKLDPWALREAGETLDATGRHRLYGWGLRWRTGTDLEMDIWKQMDAILCSEKLEIDHFRNVNRKFLCAEIAAQIRHLTNTVDKLE